MASAAARSAAVDSLFVVVPVLCGGLVLGSLCFDLQYFVSFLVLHYLAGEFSILPAAAHW